MRITKVLFVFFTILLCSCSSKVTEVSVAPYDGNSLWYYQLGRDYAANGRFELAKEYYLLALTSNNNPELEELITNELRASDLMVKTLR